MHGLAAIGGLHTVAGGRTLGGLVTAAGLSVGVLGGLAVATCCGLSVGIRGGLAVATCRRLSIGVSARLPIRVTSWGLARGLLLPRLLSLKGLILIGHVLLLLRTAF